MRPSASTGTPGYPWRLPRRLKTHACLSLMHLLQFLNWSRTRSFLYWTQQSHLLDRDIAKAGLTRSVLRVCGCHVRMLELLYIGVYGLLAQFVKRGAGLNANPSQGGRGAFEGVGWQMFTLTVLNKSSTTKAEPNVSHRPPHSWTVDTRVTAAGQLILPQQQAGLRSCENLCDSGCTCERGSDPFFISLIQRQLQQPEHTVITRLVPEVHTSSAATSLISNPQAICFNL